MRKKTFKKQPGLRRAKETLKYAQILADAIKNEEIPPKECYDYLKEFGTREELVTKLAAEMLVIKNIKGEI